ncbi:hypothetical protein GCM10007968_03120 [Sporolactobacillus putidus]|uniref:Uncharacterized protein n=2 Tax=Sporolactobacillus putidus TaxID=492735 RepID=A0A917VZD3_9BACL|nr:hypothetical protein GCM10007968_03120 [Sporolactobacillus putidus]
MNAPHWHIKAGFLFYRSCVKVFDGGFAEPAMKNTHDFSDAEGLNYEICLESD